MRVVLVTALVAGGVATHVRELASGLAADGHEVLVACPPAVVGLLGPVADLVPVVEVPVGARPHPLRDRRAVRRLHAAAAGADVVHAHGLRAGALAATACRGLRGRRPRLVVTLHNAPPEGRAGRVVFALLERVVARGADAVLGVSPDLVERARRLGARDPALAVVPAPPPAGDTVGGLDAVRARVRTSLGLAPEQPPLVLNAGRLSPQKDQGVLVAAMDLLTARHLEDPAEPTDPPVLVVAGEGPARAALEARVRAGHPRLDVRLVGHRADLRDLLLAADVVVSSARWEGQPVWLQEALQAGAAVVATDVGGTAQVLGDAAVLVPRDAGAPGLARALERLLADGVARQELRRRALERARRLPRPEDAVAAALTAYRPPGRA